MCSFAPAGESDFESGEEFEDGFLVEEDEIPKSKELIFEAGVSECSKSSISILLNNKLQTAIINDDIQAIEKLFEEIENPDVLMRCGWTVLMYSCYFAQVGIVNYLINIGAGVNYKTKDGSSPLLKACQSPKPEWMVVQCVKALLDNEADILATNEHGKTVLMVAAREGKLDVLKTIIDNCDEVVRHDLISMKDHSNWTALDWACVKDNRQCATELICFGAKVDQCLSIETWSDKICEVLEIKNLPKKEKSDNEMKTDSLAIEANTNVYDTKTEEEYIKPVMEDENLNDYVEYGQLELFFHGLDLSRLIPIFQDHDIHFEQLLCLTMEDLVLIGVNQLGARKRIIDAINECHTEKWESTSLPDFRSNMMDYDNITSLLENSADHIRYMASSIRFIENQISVHPVILNPGSSEQRAVSPNENLKQEVRELVQGTLVLCKAMKNLDICLSNQENKFKTIDQIKTDNSKNGGMFFVLALATVGCIAIFKLQNVLFMKNITR